MTTNKQLLDALDNVEVRTANLDNGVRGLAKQLESLSDYSRRSRFFIRLFVLVFIFDFFLYIVVGIFGWQTRQISAKAELASSATTVACVANNEAGAKTKELWFRTLGIPKSPPGETPAQAKVRIDKAVNLYIAAATPPGETPVERQKRVASTRGFVSDVNRIYAQKEC